MPKINSAGQPSYNGADEQELGVVTNAVGEQFVPAEPQPVDAPKETWIDENDGEKHDGSPDDDKQQDAKATPKKATGASTKK
jgi:hypothetical protein